MQYDRATSYIGRTIYQEAKMRRLIERLSDISFMPTGFLNQLVKISAWYWSEVS